MTLNLNIFVNLHNVVTKWAKKYYKQTFRIMVPTQALIKASQSLLQVVLV